MRVILFLLPLLVTLLPVLQACRQTINLNAGRPSRRFTSPRFPRLHPAKVTCTYVIVAPRGFGIKLRCPVVNLVGSRRCASVFLNYTKGKKCGRISVDETFLRRRLQIRFRSRLQRNTRSRGFRCIASLTPLPTDPPTTVPTTTDATTTDSTTTDATTTVPTTTDATTTDSTTTDATTTVPTTTDATTTDSTSTNATTSQQCSCGMRNSARIIGGQDTDVNEYPWQVLMYTFRGNSTYLCSASLITKEWLVTAAHCTEDADRILVFLGDHDRNINEPQSQAQYIVQVIEHPDYGGSPPDNDIALMRLTTPVNFTEAISPICLPFNYETLNISGENGTITGWGLTSNGGSISNILQEVDVPLITTDECRAESIFGSLVTDNMICAGVTGQGSCNGDSGGPLVWENDQSNNFLLGVVSWGGSVCAQENGPGAFTKVTNYLTWIINETGAGEELCAIDPPITDSPPTDATTTDSTTTDAPVMDSTSTDSPISQQCSCGMRNSARIIGGQDTDVNEYPWQVLMYTFRGNSTYLCSASLITKEWLVTAAHCTEDADRILVFLGDHDRNINEPQSQAQYIVQVIEHPGYGGSPPDNDIALMRLTTPVNFTEAISPICLPFNYETLNISGENGTITGWGLTSNGGSISNILQEVDVPLITTDECRAESIFGSLVTDNMICAGVTGQGSCNGDSGGPLVWENDQSNNFLLGVVSWGGSVCAQENGPGAFTKVTNYLTWIINETGAGEELCAIDPPITDSPPTDATTTDSTTTDAPVMDSTSTDSPISQQCSCGMRNSARIIGGQDTDVNEYPWQVLMYTFRGNSTYLCSASLITKEWLVTAAHCTEDADRILVFLGDHDRNINEPQSQAQYIVQVIEHPGYGGSPPDNDIALMRLTTPVNFTEAISPICLPFNYETLNISGENGTITGWGLTSNGGSISNILQEVDVPLITTDECRAESIFGSLVTDNMICAGVTGQGSCNGDSGGPLVWENDQSNNFLLGVVSWGGSVCAQENGPGAFTKVTNYLTWIINETGAGEELCAL